MKIVEKFENPDKEKTRKLKDMNAGDLVRMAEVPFPVAMREQQFYLVCKRPDALIPEKERGAYENRVCVLKIGGKSEIEWRDGDREVVEHDGQFLILPSVEVVRKAEKK
jgi:hypothetical protein